MGAPGVAHPECPAAEYAGNPSGRVSMPPPVWPTCNRDTRHRARLASLRPGTPYAVMADRTGQATGTGHPPPAILESDNRSCVQLRAG